MYVLLFSDIKGRWNRQPVKTSTKMFRLVTAELPVRAVDDPRPPYHQYPCPRKWATAVSPWAHRTPRPLKTLA